MNAMVCIHNDALKKKTALVLKQMGLKAEIVPDAGAALKNFEYHLYHLVLMDDAFDNNTGPAAIVEKMNTMDMSLRRRICLVWISDKFRTNNYMACLNASVNAIIHPNDSDHLGLFLSRTLKDHQQFYTVYNESLKMVGKG